MRKLSIILNAFSYVLSMTILIKSLISFFNKAIIDRVDNQIKMKANSIEFPMYQLAKVKY